jgi:hypothetical protein
MSSQGKEAKFVFIFMRVRLYQVAGSIPVRNFIKAISGRNPIAIRVITHDIASNDRVLPRHSRREL